MLICDVSLEECSSDRYFSCANGGGCITWSYLCDGKYDCEDHSDEENCSEYFV